jgi:hypothetical protein
MLKQAWPLLGLLAATAAAAVPGAAFQSQTTATAADVKRVMDAYQAARPADRELGVFSLDWADSLKDAKARAAREKRPIFFVATTQLKEAGDLKGGHC